MQPYTVDKQFLPKDPIEGWDSFIWTDRYKGMGDFTMVFPNRGDIQTLLAENTLIGEAGTNEVMIVLSQETLDGKLTIKGRCLMNQLNNRVIRASPQHFQKQYTAQAPPGTIIGSVVYAAVSSDAAPQQSLYANGLGFYNLGGQIADEDIPNLTLGDIYTGGASITVAMQYGPVYEVISPIAESYDLGMALYLASAPQNGNYSLKFRVYQGVDRTSSQSANAVVKFAPALDSLDKVHELKSVEGYKSRAYAFASGLPENFNVKIRPGFAEVPGFSNAPAGFNRRSIMVFCDDFKLAEGQTSVPTAEVVAKLNQRAMDALANNNFTRLVEGEVVPQSQYKFGTDYGLGDIVELANYSGASSRARITEWVRTHDAQGERAYPTVSVIQ